MEREQIVRADFPATRKGYSPEAVEAHLVAVAEYVVAIGEAEGTVGSPASELVAERAGAVLAAAEESAAEVIAAAELMAAEVLAAAEAEAQRLLAEAEAETERIRAAARTESAEAVSAANREASGRIEQARAAVESLVAQADQLRSQVGALGRNLVSNAAGEQAAEDEATAAAAEPEAGEEAESTSGPEPDVAPDPTPGPDPVAGSATPAAPSNEELIAQLRRSSGSAGEPQAPAPAAEHGAARLVAMNMALEGATRDEIAKRIESDLGPVAGVDELLDEVLARAGR